MSSLSISLEDLPRIPVEELTTATVEGEGVFDVLMRSVASHLDVELKKNSISGNNYANVYLGGLQQTLQSAVDFLVNGRKGMLEALLIGEQIKLAEVQTDKAKVELQILQANQAKIPYEIQLLQAQVDLTQQQALNAAKERDVLEAQICKLKAEYDLIMAQILKAQQEGELIAAKVATERAQTNGTGVDDRSVIGRQMNLYLAQANGFERDAEQKAAKLLIDTFNVRRTTDEGTDANTTNRLTDADIGKAVSKLLSGINA